MGRPRKGVMSKQARFAEALAATAGTEHDGDVPFVGRLFGLTTHQANAAMQNIRKRLGRQAA